MAEVEIVVKGLDRYQASLSRARLESTRQLDLLTDRAAQLLRDDTARRVPRGRSGAARASVRVVGGAGTSQVVAGGHKAPYYGWLDFGGVAGRNGARRPYNRRGRYLLRALFSLDSRLQAETEDALGRVMDSSGL